MSRVALAGLLAALVGACEPVRAGETPAPGAPRVHDPALTLDTAEEGITVRMTELGHGPYVVAPIFTRCRAVCSVLARALKSAWGSEGPAGATARVVLVSFDPEDTPEDMARFRNLFDLPSSWYLATLEREEGLRFFAELGFQWRTLARRQYDHSGKIFVLTDKLRIASVLGPDQATAERLAAEVAAAATGAAWVRRLGSHWIGFFGVGAILLGLAVAVTWDRMRSTRRMRMAHGGIESVPGRDRTIARRADARR